MTIPTLYDYWRSSASYRVRIALNWKGIAYTSVAIDLLAGAHKSQDHLARNPQGLVPVLDVDGRQLTQSLSIIEYLEETRPARPLLPADPVERQRIRALAYSVAIDIHPLVNMTMARRGAALMGGDDAMEQWMHQFMQPGLLATEKLFETRDGGPFSLGAEVSLADICIVPQVYNALRWNVPMDGMPRLQRLYEAALEIPEFAEASPRPPSP